ncbi:MAG: hypothetical protein DRH03_12290 [Deltaproteobacteria bacterium]|nr:MAG: hypothetical protein DRH03_12290 [Deltaproteobacteria bacterium]
MQTVWPRLAEGLFSICRTGSGIWS